MYTARFTINFTNKTIVGTKTSIEKAGRFGSPEYKELSALLAVHVNFQVVEKPIKSNPRKKSYHGLTFERMKQYIETQPDSEENLALFEKAKKIAESKNSQYPLTKKWFLSTFPNYKGNEVSGVEMGTAAEPETVQESTATAAAKTA